MGFIIQTSLFEIEDELMGKKELVMATVDQ